MSDRTRPAVCKPCSWALSPPGWPPALPGETLHSACTGGPSPSGGRCRFRTRHLRRAPEGHGIHGRPKAPCRQQPTRSAAGRRARMAESAHRAGGGAGDHRAQSPDSTSDAPGGPPRPGHAPGRTPRGATRRGQRDLRSATCGLLGEHTLPWLPHLTPRDPNRLPAGDPQRPRANTSRALQGRGVELAAPPLGKTDPAHKEAELPHTEHLRPPPHTPALLG